MVDVMNRIGFTHTCLGNHEFELSVSNLIDRVKESKFKVINTNIKDIPGTYPSDQTAVTLVDGSIFKIGWLGFCTEKTRRLCINVPHDIHFEPIRECYADYIKSFRDKEKPDFLVT